MMSVVLCIQYLLSSPPPYLPSVAVLILSTQPEEEIKGWCDRLFGVYESVCLTSAGDCDWVKMSMFLADYVGCVHMNLTTLGKSARSICVPHISHVTVWMKHWQGGVCRLYTFNSDIWEQPSALNSLKDPSKAIVNGVKVLFLARQLKLVLGKKCLCDT